MVTGVPAIASQSAAKASAATPRDCQSLLHQFDVAVATKRDPVKVAAARKNRDLASTECQRGNYVEGVRGLRKALHEIGVKPVKVVQSRSAMP
jgi:hypothetical protein